MRGLQFSKLHLTSHLMRSRHVIWAVCLVVAVGQSLGFVMAQEIDFKDLTKAEANPLRYKKFVPDPDCALGGGSGGGTIGCPPAFYPFHLALLSVDANHIQLGGEVIALLRLENVGHDAAWVPWSTDPDQIELPDSHGSFAYMQSELTANFTPENGVTEYIQCPVILYGAKDVGGTLREIRPGEFVELRVKVALDGDPAESRVKSWKPGPVRFSITWTEWDCRETYEKCRTSSSRSRLRQLSSNTADLEFVVQRASR